MKVKVIFDHPISIEDQAQNDMQKECQEKINAFITILYTRGAYGVNNSFLCDNIWEGGYFFSNYEQDGFYKILYFLLKSAVELGANVRETCE